MNRPSTIILAILLLSNCRTLPSNETCEYDRESSIEAVQAPFRDMIANNSSAQQVLGSVLFEFNDSSLSRNAKEELERIANTIAHQDGVVVVEGHTDHVNAESFNICLGYRRALAVAHYLKSAGVWDEKMVVRSFGENRPTATNWTDENRAENRRVVIRLLTQTKEMSGTEALAAHRRLTEQDSGTNINNQQASLHLGATDTAFGPEDSFTK
ncbi:MAG: OmpA family protein [bacterium]